MGESPCKIKQNTTYISYSYKSVQSDGTRRVRGKKENKKSEMERKRRKKKETLKRVGPKWRK